MKIKPMVNGLLLCSIQTPGSIFRIALLILIILCTIAQGWGQQSSASDQSAHPARVALLPVTREGFPPELSHRLRTNFGDGLSLSKRFELIADSTIDFRLRQIGPGGIDSCRTVECLAELGRSLGADDVVNLLAAKWDQRMMLHIQMIRSADAALLYDERVDYTGEIDTLATTIAKEQGRKLAGSYLDRKPNWLLIGCTAFGGTALILLILRRLGRKQHPGSV